MIDYSIKCCSMEHNMAKKEKGVCLLDKDYDNVIRTVTINPGFLTLQLRSFNRPRSLKTGRYGKKERVRITARLDINQVNELISNLRDIRDYHLK